MSEEKKKSKTIHVDTLHIKANEIILHQDPQEGAGPNVQGPMQGQQQGPGQVQGQPGMPPQFMPRDFWGFPIRQFPVQQQQQQEEQTEENAQEAQENQNQDENNQNPQNQDGGQNQPPQPRGWF
ncbi:hypothetical protein JOD45_000244 [Scopulibacillus daqui]|uniref:Uncharacterized protein n=1 Tax=Scopulibacillus daqui TaxID=1469162 RepID=A0ABS2PVG6_9BACL|nr:hypothetical protein [Scopulibacillus daqui]MBM7644053.1 hypothetical protein [Scopulibacillus daqui]